MNPWGIVVIAVGAIIVWIGVRGTQGSLFADIFGHPYQSAHNGPSSIQLPAGSSIGTFGPNGIGTQGSQGLQSGNGTQLPGGASIGGGTVPKPSSGSQYLGVGISI